MDPTTVELAKKWLVEELAQSTINVLRIRALCRDFPGLIASTGLRTRIWSLLLLGPDAHYNTENTGNLPIPGYRCLEQHVLEADVRRTRSEVDEFRSTEWRRSIHVMLQHFCLSHDIEYKQGMNEVLAPFLYLQPPPKGNTLPYALFEAFLFRYLERHLCQDDSSFLFKAFRLFHVLLLYHDPQLALHLHNHDFPPELYAPQWFLTLYSRCLPLQHVLRLWDMIVAVDDPSFTFFIGMGLLRRQRQKLLLADADDIPEIIQYLGFAGEEEVDAVVCDAVAYYKLTPRSLCRSLRLCCVSTFELTPQPRYKQRSSSSGKGTSISSSSSSNRDHMVRGESSTGGMKTGTMNKQKQHQPAVVQAWGGGDHDLNMAVQAARTCVMLSPMELVSALLPVDKRMVGEQSQQQQQPQLSSISERTGDMGSSSQRSIEGDKGIHPSETGTTVASPSGGIWGGIQGGGAGSGLQQFVLIDVRSLSESDSSGGGLLPCAILLESEFMDRPDAFSVWLQHFDATRGCNICIIDMPPVAASGVALWRRLLLGQGDGALGTSILYNTPFIRALTNTPSFSPSFSSSAPPKNSSSTAVVGGGGAVVAVDAAATEEGASLSDTSAHAAKSVVTGTGSSSTASSAKEQQEEGVISKAAAVVAPSPPSRVSRDLQSPYAQAEAAAVADDAVRPAVRLAHALQRDGFPNVCVLDGGFPALIDQLLAWRGTVEPVVIDHDQNRWRHYLQATGRAHAALPLPPPPSSSSSSSSKIFKEHQASPPEKDSRTGAVTGTGRVETGPYAGGGGRDTYLPTATADSPSSSSRRRSNMTEVEIAQMAYKVAHRLGHKHMEVILLERINDAIIKTEADHRPRQPSAGSSSSVLSANNTLIEAAAGGKMNASQQQQQQQQQYQHSDTDVNNTSIHHHDDDDGYHISNTANTTTSRKSMLPYIMPTYLMS